MKSHRFIYLLLTPNRKIQWHLLQVPPPTFELGFGRWVNCRLLIRCSVLLAALSSNRARSGMRSTAKHSDIQISGDHCQTPSRFPSIQNTTLTPDKIIFATSLVPAAGMEVWAAVLLEFRAHTRVKNRVVTGYGSSRWRTREPAGLFSRAAPSKRLFFEDRYCVGRVLDREILTGRNHSHRGCLAVAPSRNENPPSGASNRVCRTTQLGACCAQAQPSDHLV